MADAPPIVTLLTDFGLSDAYVGVMKGVILSRCADARIVDLTHHVEPGNIHAASHLLAGAWSHFPDGTVHTIVVDPGVGSDRRVLAAAVGTQRFVAPDNGVLSGVFDEQAPARVIDVTNAAVFRERVSRTFHGRDIFAPVGAAIASGMALDELGEAMQPGAWIHLPRIEPVVEDDAVRGQVVYVDRFGNLVTNVCTEDIAMFTQPRVQIAGTTIDRIVDSYAAVSEGDVLAVIGSTDHLEISVNRGSAATVLNADVGTPVRVRAGRGEAFR